MLTIDRKSINLWRVHIKPDAQPGFDPVTFCLVREIIGIGWAIDSRPSSKGDYWAKGKTKYNNIGWEMAAKAILYEMQEDDLVWIRDAKGIYYLGKITSDWKYIDSPINLACDVVNVRKCEFFKVGANIPDKLINHFYPPAAIQRINDDALNLFSRVLYNYLSGQKVY